MRFRKYLVRKRMLGCAVIFCTGKCRGETLTGIEDRPFRLAGLGMRESFACDDGIKMPLRGLEIRLEVEALALGGKKSEGLRERLAIAKREQSREMPKALKHEQNKKIDKNEGRSGSENDWKEGLVLPTWVEQEVIDNYIQRSPTIVHVLFWIKLSGLGYEFNPLLCNYAIIALKTITTELPPDGKVAATACAKFLKTKVRILFRRKSHSRAGSFAQSVL